MSLPENIGEILNKLHHVKPLNDGSWQADCPCSGHSSPDGHFTIKDGGDKALVTCFNTHTYKDICDALGYTSLTFIRGSKDSGPKIITNVYPYQNEQGGLIFEVCRFIPKSFAQRLPDGTWGLQGTQPTIYHLPEVKKAISQGQIVYICEGEKDADNIHSAFGVTATTNPMGAGKWRDSYSRLLAGAKQVIIFSDNDEPGQKHANKVAESLSKVNVPCKIIQMPRPEIKDVSDWMNDGLTTEIFKTLIQDIPIWIKKKDKSEPLIEVSEDNLHRTDYGNALRLISRHGKDMRYCRLQKDWYVFTGKYWERGIDRVYDFAKETVRSILIEASEIEEKDERESMVKWALQSESNQRITAMMTLAESDPSVRVVPSDFDRDPWLLNCQNGTIDLRDGILKEQDRNDLITHCLHLEYLPDALSKTWNSFLEQILPDIDTRSFIQRAIGYSATGSQNEQAFFFAKGPPATGKSTFLGAILDVLGQYAGECEPRVFMIKKYGETSGPNEDIANLRGIRFLISTELEPGQRLDVGFVKRVTGGETITSNRKHEHAFQFKPEFKLWLCGNHEPQVDDTTNALWRRMYKTPFEQEIPINERIKGFRDILSGQDGEAILAWIVKGSVDAYTEGALTPSDEVKKATAQYQAEQDLLAEFLDDCCVQGAGTLCTSKAMYSAYQTWAFNNRYPTLPKHTFNKAMMEKNFEFKRGTANKPTFFGVGLITHVRSSEEQG